MRGENEPGSSAVQLLTPYEQGLVVPFFWGVGKCSWAFCLPQVIRSHVIFLEGSYELMTIEKVSFVCYAPTSSVSNCFASRSISKVTYLIWNGGSTVGWDCKTR